MAKKHVCITVLMRPPHARVPRDAVRVDREHAQTLGEDRLLDLARQSIPELVGWVRRVEKEGRTVRSPIEHVETFEETELVTGDEPCLPDQVARLDRSRTESQMGHRCGAGLLRVVDEIALDVSVGVVADDLDRVLVGAHGAVGSESVEHRAHDVRRFDVEVLVVGQREMGDVVDDADGERRPRRLALELIEDRDGHRRGELLARQPEAPADQPRCGSERRRVPTAPRIAASRRRRR